MLDYQRQFIQSALEHQVLQFGHYTLKSGRKSPYFFNAGLFNSGQALQNVGQAYAKTILQQKLVFDVLFGPAYKGIPLVSATALSLAAETAAAVPYCFDRKEAKTHGECGLLIGSPLQGKVIVIDDVITAGTAIRHAISLIQQAGAELQAVVVAFDRQECGSDNTVSAIAEIEHSFNTKVYSIITFSDLITYVQEQGLGKEIQKELLDYRRQYGYSTAP